MTSFAPFAHICGESLGGVAPVGHGRPLRSFRIPRLDRLDNSEMLAQNLGGELSNEGGGVIDPVPIHVWAHDRVLTQQ